MTIYPLTVTAVAFILAALLLREKLRRTEASEEVEVLRTDGASAVRCDG